MGRFRLRYATAALIVAATFGCDRAPAPSEPAPPPTSPPAVPPPAPKRPSTQALMEAPWKTVPVSVLPLTMRVPQSWESVTATDTGLMTFEGWTPSGFAQIRAAARPGLAGDAFDSFIKAARADAETKGAKLRKFEIRAGDPMSILERQITGDLQTMPTMDDQGNLIDHEATPLRWTLLLFFKRESGRFDCYEMWFDALSVEQFEKDQEFLRKVVDSLTYDASRKPE